MHLDANLELNSIILHKFQQEKCEIIFSRIDMISFYYISCTLYFYYVILSFRGDIYILQVFVWYYYFEMKRL